MFHLKPGGTSRPLRHRTRIPAFAEVDAIAGEVRIVGDGTDEIGSDAPAVSMDLGRTPHGPDDMEVPEEGRLTRAYPRPDETTTVYCYAPRDGDRESPR
jgi:hypothetical protein